MTSLKQMAEAHVEGVQKATFFKIDPRVLEVDPEFNVRLPCDDLEAYIASLKHAFRLGAIFPAIDVRTEGDRIIIVDGHCRTRAYKELIAEGEDIKRVDAREVKESDIDRILHMLGTAEGRALSTLEQGIGYLRLVKFGWSNAEIASNRSKSISHVEQALTLATANADVHALIASGAVSGRTAIAAIKKHGEGAGAFLQALVDGSGKAKITQQAVSGKRLPPKLVDRCEKAISGMFSTESIASMLKELEGVETEIVMIDVPKAFLVELLEARAAISELRGEA